VHYRIRGAYDRCCSGGGVMGKRFGRNQRRKMKEDVAHRDNLLILRERLHLDEINQWHKRLDRLKHEGNEAIRAARMARDTIRISINSLIDDRERKIRMTARFDNLSLISNELYSAMDFDFDSLSRHSDIERNAFIKLVGEQIAQNALEQIMRHWRVS